MESSVWTKALSLLKYDPNIDSVTYDSILCKMSVAHCDNDLLVLAARDDFSLGLVKGQKLGKIIENAIKTVNEDKPLTVNFVKQDDIPSLESTINAGKKAARQAKTEVVTPTGLNGEFTFANFVVGDCNRFAHASAVSVAAKPGQKQRNPFFLWVIPDSARPTS